MFRAVADTFRYNLRWARQEETDVDKQKFEIHGGSRGIVCDCDDYNCSGVSADFRAQRMEIGRLSGVRNQRAVGPR
jgi:hypothetical protein